MAEWRVQSDGRNIALRPTVEELQFAVEELHIYEAELEIQNEELLEGRALIEESQQKYFRHFDLAPVGLIRLTAAGLVVEANILAAQMLGVNRAQFYLGKRPFLAHVARDSHGVFQQHFEDAFASGTPESCELTLRGASGAESFVRMQSVRSRGTGGTAELYVTLTDLSDRRRIESELAGQKLLADAATHAAEAAKLAKEQFFAMLSHELRTPLTPLLALIGELEGSPGRSTDDCAVLATMRRNLELEARLVDDLLDLTRINNGKLSLRRAPTDVHLCLAQAVELCRADLEARELFFELELGAARHVAYADGKRLQQVFGNLLGNAIKFTPAGGRIAVRTLNSADQLVVEIQDTGVGIEGVALERVFDPFMQADGCVPRRFGGLGLGLAIARSITETHGGWLRVFSAGTGHGATFRLEIPVSDQPAAEAPPPFRPAVATAPRQHLRLLLVEDHDDTRGVLQLLLQRRGYPVESARNAAGARALCATQSFDLLITDLGLPDASGSELLHELSGKYRLPGIAVSGFGADADFVQSKAAGFLEHFVKPLDLPELDAAIQRSAANAPGIQTEWGPLLPPAADVASDGFAELVEEHVSAAYRFAFCMSLSSTAAAGLTEVVFANARRMRSRGLPPACFRTWLLAALHREWTLGSGEAYGSSVETPAREGLLITAHHAAQCDQSTVASCIHEMPARLRFVLSLFYSEQLGHREIARILLLPDATALAHLAAAKTLLRRQLEQRRLRNRAS